MSKKNNRSTQTDNEETAAKTEVVELTLEERVARLEKAALRPGYAGRVHHVIDRFHGGPEPEAEEKGDE